MMRCGERYCLGVAAVRVDPFPPRVTGDAAYWTKVQFAPGRPPML
jgi:hypothetical protein